ncbi:MAG TPA: hypothetical protein VFZ65_04120 [Planctomycetota bacterium]|nr:hypothetical protein [Planctomycetota bacterium]
MLIPHLLRRLHGALLPVLAVAALGAPARNQVPTPPPPPVPEPQPQPETPTQEPAQEPEQPAAPERGGRRRGQGPQGARQNQDLPEFTPVAAPPLAGLQGKQFFWFTMYPDFVVKYDPQTDTVVQKVKLEKGMFWNTTLTHDRKRLLVVTEQQHTIEVVDLGTGTLLGSHPFVEENFVLRIRDVRELPGGVFWFVRTDRVKKEIDRYSFEPSQWLLYDSNNKKVVRKSPRLPDALDRDTQLSADGTHWIGQDDDGNLQFLDARKLTEFASIDLRTPRYFGAGPLRLTGTDLLDGRDPKRARMLFTSTDPVEKTRTSWGVVELDLENKRIVDVQEWGPQVSAWGLRVAPKKLVAAAMSGSFGGGRGNSDNRTRLLLYDLRTGQKIAEAYEEFRPRRSLVAISPDADKIYIGTAGSDFEVFDAQLKRQKTVELEGEIVGRIHVVDG